MRKLRCNNRRHVVTWAGYPPESDSHNSPPRDLLEDKWNPINSNHSFWNFLSVYKTHNHSLYNTFVVCYRPQVKVNKTRYVTNAGNQAWFNMSWNMTLWQKETNTQVGYFNGWVWELTQSERREWTESREGIEKRQDRKKESDDERGKGPNKYKNKAGRGRTVTKPYVIKPIFTPAVQTGSYQRTPSGCRTSA
jgi:hypothetical protein